jgi:ElaB/YqjD/DUF883 family membrane-anchored ribosome-binding protein
MRAVKNEKDSLSEPIEAIKEDLSQLGTDVASAGRAVVQTGRHAITSSASKMTDQVAKQAKSLHQSVCDFTADRPTTSLMIAMGVGAVMGLWLFRKR